MTAHASVLTSPARMYRATVRTAAFSVSTAIYFVLGTVVIPGAIMKWAPQSREVYSGVLLAMVVSGVISLMLAFRKEMVRIAANPRLNHGSLSRYVLNVSPYLFIGLFGALAFLHFKIFGGFIHGGDVTNTFGRMNLQAPVNWFLFVLENLSSAIFLDLMEAYKFKFSTIDYTSPVFGTVVFIFRLVVGVYFWKIIYNMLKYNVARL